MTTPAPLTWKNTWRTWTNDARRTQSSTSVWEEETGEGLERWKMGRRGSGRAGGEDEEGGSLEGGAQGEEERRRGLGGGEEDDGGEQGGLLRAGSHGPCATGSRNRKQACLAGTTGLERPTSS